MAMEEVDRVKLFLRCCPVTEGEGNCLRRSRALFSSVLAAKKLSVLG